MNLVELNIPQPDNTAEKRAQQALALAESFSVANAEDYQAAADELMAIKSRWREIEDMRKSLKAPVDEAARRIQSFFRSPLDFLAQAELVIKRKMVTWKTEQDRIAREEARRAEEKARKERERLEAQARKAEEEGRTERAEILRDRAEVVVPQAPPPTAPKVSGISERTVWKFEIVDASKVPDKYKVVDEKKVRQVVNALKGDAEIPGVRVWEENVLGARLA
jgi:hypothetical protein